MKMANHGNLIINCVFCSAPVLCNFRLLLKFSQLALLSPRNLSLDSQNSALIVLPNETLELNSTDQQRPSANEKLFLSESSEKQEAAETKFPVDRSRYFLRVESPLNSNFTHTMVFLLFFIRAFR